MQFSGFNLANKLRQTPLSATRCLVPLYEAVANSMNSIAEGRIDKGRITIVIHRDTSQASVLSDSVPSQPVIGFDVQDNGVGFNDDNLSSFKVAYSPRKQAVGGKGIGRVYWLKAFSRAEIDSVYENGTTRKRRRFTFALDDDSDETCEVTDAARSTVVRLIDYLPAYREKCPTKCDTIAKRIISHFLEYFMLKQCPEIWIRDDYEGQNFSLNTMFRTQLKFKTESKSFELHGNRFKIQHYCLASLPDVHHEIHFCALHRSVVTKDAKELIPSIRGPLDYDDGAPFVYAACVSGDLLETSVDESRGQFGLPDEKSLLDTPGVTSWQALERKVAEKSNEFLSSYLTPLRDKNNDRIRQYIDNVEPRYRPLAKHREKWFDRIPPAISDAELSIELYRLDREYDQELLEKRPTRTKLKSSASLDSRKRQFAEFLQEWNDHGTSKLAEYVIHRKATLEFLEDSLSIIEGNAYAAESQIHSIICPMKTTSDDVPVEQMNLWIIDERLAFHRYLASDKRMDSLEPVQTDSKQRADLVLFNHAASFADDQFDSVSIIEFKRPMRDDYTDKENPIQQVYDYVETLRTSNPTTIKGRPLPKLDVTPFYAYIICDVTPKLRRLMKSYGFVGAADGESFFNYNSGHLVYVEIMSFAKLVDNSKKRNEAFFHKLGLHKSRIVPADDAE